MRSCFSLFCSACFILFIGSVPISEVQAGKFNPLLNIGDTAPSWSDLPGVDGKTHSLADLKNQEVIVVAFTCNSCPTAGDYEDRMIALAKSFAARGNCALVAICPNRVAEDLLPKLQERAQTKKFNFAYLHDESQKIARSFGASYTPEFYVLNRERKIVYMGALDDNTDATLVKVKFVEDAVHAALAGKTPAVTETPARGCAVRYVRDRTKK